MATSKPTLLISYFDTPFIHLIDNSKPLSIDGVVSLSLIDLITYKLIKVYVLQRRFEFRLVTSSVLPLVGFTLFYFHSFRSLPAMS